MRVNNEDFDKSGTIKVKMTKHLELNLTQQLYTFFLRFSDLNLSYTDGFQTPLYDNFRNLPDHFNCKGLPLPFLLKSNISVSIPSLALNLIHSSKQISQFSVKQAKINVKMFLNNRMRIET